MSLRQHPQCKNGHPVVKHKSELKFWQGRLSERICDQCNRIIERQVPHWSCDYHCGSHLCLNCYRQHWMRLIQKAARTQDPLQRREMLQAVPRQLRNDPEYVAVAGTMESPQVPYRPAAASSSDGKKGGAHAYLTKLQPGASPQIAAQRGMSPGKPAPMSPGKPMSPTNRSMSPVKPPRSMSPGKPQRSMPAAAAAYAQPVPAPKGGIGMDQGAYPPGASPPLPAVMAGKSAPAANVWRPSPLVEVTACVVVLMATTPYCTVLTTRLLSDEALQFPSPWLMIVVSNLLAAGLLFLVSFATRHTVEAHVNVEEVPWKWAGCLGVMFGIEEGVKSFVTRGHSPTSQSQLYALLPLFMLIAAALSNTEPLPLPRLLVCSTICLCVGGVLLSWSPLDNWSPLHIVMVLCAGFITMMRWVFVNNVFLNFWGDRPPHLSPSVVVLATRMLPTTACMGMELTVMTDGAGFLQLLHFPYPLTVYGSLLAIGVGVGLTLVAELRLVQLTSATSLGVLLPLRHLSAMLIASPMLRGTSGWGQLPAPMCVWVGLAFVIGGTALFAYVRMHPENLAPFVSPQWLQEKLGALGMGGAEAVQHGAYQRMAGRPRRAPRGPEVSW